MVILYSWICMIFNSWLRWYHVKMWCSERSYHIVFFNLQKPLLRRLRSPQCSPATTPLRISGTASFQNQGEFISWDSETPPPTPPTNQILWFVVGLLWVAQITVWNSNSNLLLLSLYSAYVILKPEFAFPLSYYLIPFTGVVGMIIIVMCVVLVSNNNNTFYLAVFFKSPMVTLQKIKAQGNNTSHY